MSRPYLETPVALIIFKRPDLTEKVFQSIRAVKPKTLLVIADGHRSERSGEEEQCATTRRIIDQVDWDCEVLKNYSSINLGCGIRPATGLDWVFDQVEQAIILEDDCLPDSTFFYFCEDLLNRYRDDERVMNICGSKFANSSEPHSYYFSKYGSFWGWATWRRAWKYFDFKMTGFSELDRDWLDKFLHDRNLSQFWFENFKMAADPNRNDIWDFQWEFACWMQHGLSIRPQVNLIRNLGFTEDATHTFNTDYMSWYNPVLESMSFPLKHPQRVIPDLQAEQIMQEQMLSYRKLGNRIRRKIRKLWR